MELVVNKPAYPSRCAITGRVEGEMLDTKQDIPCPMYLDKVRVYLSRGGVEKVAKFFGLVTEANYTDLAKQCLEQQKLIRKQTEELEFLRKLETGIEALENYNYKPRGRMPRRKVAA